MKLNIYVTEREIHTLGPYARFGIWVQGCNKRCPGCIAAESHSKESGKETDTGALAWEVITSDTEGITISGGEPFLQAEALTELIGKIRRHRDVGVIIYTGYLIEELENIPFAKELLACTDLLIDGPYVKELDDGKSLRGSSNQRVIPLTERYREHLSLYGADGRSTEVHMHTSGIHIVGIVNNNK